MADPKFTRCPGCKTVFRVTPEQLALRNGQVRCGHCRAVFDGNAHAISLAPNPLRDEIDDDLARGPATVTLRSSRALEVPPTDAPRAVPVPGFTPPALREPSFEPESASAPKVEGDAKLEAGPEPKASASEDAGEDKEAHADDADAAPAGEPAPARRIRLRTVLYGVAIPVLVAIFALQALVHFRDAIAARLPAAKPLLTRLCDPLGCSIRPLRDIAGLSIDASDLQADPAHKGLLVLTATLRNRTPIALAYPYLELTLTDAADTVVVRRALTPPEYAGGTANHVSGFPANSELLVKMFIDASATTQAGYRLYLYYP